MSIVSLVLRTALYAAGFLWLWAWVAQRLRPFDDSLGGPLPEWCAAAGTAAMAAGAIVTVWCLGAFVVRGRGTPALFDAPRRLVAWGPYGHTRNPMYIGGALLLMGFGLFERSPSIVVFVPAWWLMFHLLAVFYEEKILRVKFGTDYDDYCRRTPRWIPRLRPRRQTNGAGREEIH